VKNFEWYDAIRVCTAVISLCAMYTSSRRALYMWSMYTRRLRELWWAVMIFLLLLLEGSLEQIVLDIPWGPRTILSFVVSIVFLRATLRKEGFLKTDYEDLENSK
jgi:hypothetical protein